MDPGTIIALTQVGYKLAEKTVSTVSSALSYFEDSESLAVKLEANRALLKIWGKNSGVEDGLLEPSLMIVHELVQRQLAAISAEFEDADKMMKRYDLAMNQAFATMPPQDRVQRSLVLMKRSLSMIGVKGDAATPSLTPPDALATIETPVRSNPGLIRRTRWGFHDKEKLGEIIASLSVHVSLLNQLLTESQRRNAGNDAERVKIVLVGAVQDAETLKTLRQALREVPGAAETVARLDRKAIVDDQPWSDRRGPLTLKPFEKEQFRFPRDYAVHQRFLARPANGDTSAVYLLEKKAFDANLKPDELHTLTERIQRLVQLLSTRRTEEFQVPTAAGFIQDSHNFCWWLVFHFPMHQPLALIGPCPVPQPLSLLSLLDPALKIRPPLELRYRLAASICTTFSELYSSSWLHKGISSKNILFRGQAPEKGMSSKGSSGRQQSDVDYFTSLLSEPLVCGFDYSRQETEEQTIDRARASSDISSALYRHPNYQGDAAQGYKLAYDVYSLGMVLLEIALWVPIRSFLEAKKSQSSNGQSGPAVESRSAGTELSPSTHRFHREESIAFGALAMDRVNREFAFRVGGGYRDVVKWCLTFADKSPGDAQDQPAALQFHDQVLVPLRRLASTSRPE